SPRGTYLAVVVLDGKNDDAGQTRILKLYEGATGKELSSTPLTAVLVGQTPRNSGAGSLWAPIFSPDESLVAISHNTSSGTPRIDWYFVEPKTGQIRRTLEDPVPARSSRFFGSGSIPGTQGTRFFSDDGKQFICVVDNAIHSLPVVPGLQARTFRGHAG